MTYEKDRRRIAYSFAAATIVIVGYLTVSNPEALNPVVVGIISLFLVCTLALLGVENPIRQREGEPNDTYLERLAKGGEKRDGGGEPPRRDQGEAHPRNDRCALLGLWSDYLAGFRFVGSLPAG